MEYGIFTQLRFLPDPMISPSDPEHYLSFEDAIQKETSEIDCPSLQGHKKDNFIFPKHTACKECGCDSAV